MQHVKIAERRFVGHVRNGNDARRNPNAARGQHLQADAARNAKRRGQAAGEVSAARNVLIAAVFDLSGVIRVARAGNGAQCIIVL